MGQCTQDITGDECYNCLRKTSAEYPSCCFGNVGGVVRAPSCNVRYEVYPFYGVTPPQPSPPTPAETPSNGKELYQLCINFTSLLKICFSLVCCF